MNIPAHHTTDIVVIGAGPVGLFTVFQCGMLGMQCHVVDALPAIGGQCRALYPEKPIYDIPAWPSISADALIDQLTQQAAPFAPTYHVGQTVSALEGDEKQGFKIITSSNTSIACRAVIIAAGAGAFGPNRPPLEGIEDYEGHNVHYMIERRNKFDDQRLVIAGGGDSAVDWALALHDAAAHITFIHRRDSFRAAPESVSRLRAMATAPNPKLDILTPYQLHGLQGSNGKLNGVILRNIETETDTALPADHLLAFFGLATDVSALADFDLEMDRTHIITDPATAATSRAGVFAVGDIATYPHKLKLILTGFAEAAAAAHQAYGLVFEGRALHFEYSTTKGITAAKA